MNDGINLDVISVDYAKEDMSDKIQYPCVFIDGIDTLEEVDFFSNLKTNDRGNILPLYIIIDGVTKRVCDFDLSFANLLLLSRMSNYKLKLFRDETNGREIDLSDPEELLLFITL